MNIKKNAIFIAAFLALYWIVPLGINGQQAAANDPVLNFDHAWKTLDRNYGQFLVKHVDWDALYRLYRPMVSATTTDPELWDILLSMMGHLNDAHLALADGKRRVAGGRNNGSFTNDEFSLNLVKSKYLQGKFTEALGGSFISGWLGAGAGYLYIGDLKDGLEPITKTIDAVMAEFAKARVMIVDVRNNPGGTGRAVEIVAGRFADRRRHYETDRTRYGPKHDDFWPENFCHIEPGGPLQYNGPTVLLTDRISASAAEGFTLAMRVLPHVTVVGETTEGALSSQFPERMPNGWTLWVAFKECRDHEGVCWDGVGIPPDLRVNNTAADIAAGRDRMLEFAKLYLEKGAPALQDEAKSLVDVKISLVNEYARLAKDKGVEAAVAMLNAERTARSGMYFFSPEEAMQGAVSFLARRQYAEALGLLRACRGDFPTLAHTYAMLAQAYIGLGDVASAETSMKEGEKVEPMFSWERTQIEQARLALRKAQLGSAAKLFGESLAVGGVPAAEKKLKQLLKSRLNGPVFDEADFNALGYKLLQENRLELSLYVFEKSARLYPDSWNAWDSLGEAAAKANRKEQAIASYRKSLELNPGNKNGLEMLRKLEQ
ncbi:MAG: S41 family peptidase [Acidobacteria bacterium]|jgi:tetratricopeptide (TPR) repeat protein|nr:S41 family peptidase [Acidobacteriota bacterium]